MKYVTSDWHFFHKNIFGKNGFCKTREHFKDVSEMNETIIQNYNKVVTNSDEVYMLGDVAIHGTPKEVHGLLERLRGTIYFVEGNHDNNRLFNYLKSNNPILASTRKDKFRFIPMGTTVKRKGIKYYLTHYPQRLGEYRKDIRNICGHIHEFVAEDPNVINVGIDSPEIDIRPFGQPLPLDEAMDKVDTKWSIWYEFVGKQKRELSKQQV